MPQSKPKILLVEDDQLLGYVVKEFLQNQNFDVFLCATAEEAWNTFMKNKFSLCLVDIMLPGKNNGMTLAGNIRKKNIDIPIIVLSSKNLNEDIQDGFKGGADDYITKPYNLQELLVRMQVFLRRSEKVKENKIAPIPVGDLTFDYTNLTLRNDNKEYTLTLREADMMRYLCQNANRLIKRSDILMAIWGNDTIFLGRSMDVFITRIRKYLKFQTKVKLETVHGIGFKFRNDMAEGSLN